MNCNPPDSSVHGISQARILERVAISFSRESSHPQGSNSHLLYWQVDSLPLSHLGSPDQLKEIPGGMKGNQKMFRSFIMGFPRKCHHLPSDSRTFPRAVPGDTLSMCYFSPLMSAICFAGTQGPSGKDVWDTQC